MATKQLNFKIEAELEQEIRERAESEGLTVGQWLQGCARKCLKEEEVTPNGDIPSISTNDSNGHKDDQRHSEYHLSQHDEKIAEHDKQLEELKEKISSLESAYQRVTSMVEELYVPPTPISDDSNSDSPSISDDSNSDSPPISDDSNSDSPPISDDEKLVYISQRELSKRLRCSKTTVANKTRRGGEEFKAWSKSLDPEQVEWHFDQSSNKIFCYNDCS